MLALPVFTQLLAQALLGMYSKKYVIYFTIQTLQSSRRHLRGLTGSNLRLLPNIHHNSLLAESRHCFSSNEIV